MVKLNYLKKGEWSLSFFLMIVLSLIAGFVIFGIIMWILYVARPK